MRRHSVVRIISALTAALCACLLRSAAGAADAPSAACPWFTDVTIAGAVRMPRPAEALPDAPGTNGRGVLLSRGVAIDDPLLKRSDGLITFWVRPRWNGNDARVHRLLRIGDPAHNGLLVEKAATGMLRYVMASPEKVVASRTDVSAWKAGEWHQVAFAWTSRDGAPIGLPLWVDRVAMDGPVAGGCTFLDPAAMSDRRVWIGDATADAAMDELVFRDRLDTETRDGLVATVYRDYLRAAPYDAIRVDPEPLRVPADRRVAAGLQKQFGLLARRQGRWEPVTDYAVRYGQWASFDAKPFIRWSSSEAAIAAPDANGRVVGKRPGACTLHAVFRGMRASYPLAVIPAERPDLDLICTELLPRYRSDAAKDRPAPGEAVAARVRLGNYGPVPLPAGAVVRLDLVPVDARDPYRFNPRMRSVQTFTATVGRAQASGEETAVEFRFAYPAQPVWMWARLDPDDRVDELCEANNAAAERIDARPIQMGYAPKALAECLAQRKVNHVGSLSYYDWLRAEKLRMDVMLREAVYPTTTPLGVQEAYRIDAIRPLVGGNWDDEPYNKEAVYFDGGFPVNEPVDLMAIDAAIIHEFGHTILSQPDLYGYPMRAANVLLNDDNGKPYAGSPLLPIVGADDTLPFSHALNVPCGGGYASLMDYCHLWLHPSQAGHIMHYRGYRPDRFWGTQGRLVPTRANWLMVTDVEDRPLKGAAVYVYGVTNAPVQDSGAKYFADRPKFVGQTDGEGRFVFPGETDADWDDAETDEVDGSIGVWNPFGRVKSDTAFTPNVWTVEGLLLVKVVSGAQTEFQWLDLTQFNEEFLSGHDVCGDYPVRTSLQSASAPTPVVRRPVPEAIRRVNKRPVAVAPAELTITCGQSFQIDGSKSYDPEGQPLYYRWNVNGQWLSRDLHQGPVVRLKAPDKPGTLEYRFWVLDGLRSSEPVTVKVNVKAAPPAAR